MPTTVRERSRFGPTPVVAQNEPAAAPSPETPKPILASYTPAHLAEHEIAADAA